MDFPRSAKYHPEWLRWSASSGANVLWLTEWLTGALDLRPAMRVLDLGCGRAASSIFLHREFDVEVFAADLWFSASENARRISAAGCADHVFPIHADARSLPFAENFFDAILSIDSFPYYGTDDLYLHSLARFLKPSGILAICGAGLTREIDGPIPAHLREWWTQDLWCLHSADWWRRHWERTGIVNVELADTMPGGWRLWLDWHKSEYPDNAVEIAALESDRGAYLGYTRTIARRDPSVKLSDPILSIPPDDSTPPPLLTPRR